MKEIKDTPKTYGDKPVPFSFSFDDGESDRYYIGSEVRISLVY